MPQPSLFARFLHSDSSCIKLSRKELVVAAVAFAVPLLVYFLPILGPGRVLSAVWGDIAAEWWWKRGYLGELLRRFELGQINPYMMSGVPFLASNQTAILYPFNWLFGFLPRAFVFNFQTIFHFWLGLFAMYVLLRKLSRSICASALGALVFGFGGFAILHWWQGHLVFVLEWPWTPLAVLSWMMIQDSSRERRRRLWGVIALAFVLSMQFLSGHPQIVYFTLLILAAFHLAWIAFATARADFRIAITGTTGLVMALVLTGAMCAIQALPTLRFAELSERSTLGSMAYFLQDSHAPGDMLTSFCPWAFGGNTGPRSFLGNSATYWEVGVFVTAAACIAAYWAIVPVASVSAFSCACAVMTFLAWWLALGRHTGLYEFTFRYLPGLSLFRCPGRFVYIVTFGIALLAASGLDRVVLITLNSVRKFWIGVAVLILLLAGAALTILILFPDGGNSSHALDIIMRRANTIAPPQPRLTPAEIIQASRRFYSSLWQGVGFLAFAAAATALVGFPRLRRAAAPIILTLAICEAAMFSIPYREAFLPASQAWPQQVRKTLRMAGTQFRYASARVYTDLCQGMEAKVRHIWGYEAGVTKRYSTALGTSQGYTISGTVPQWLFTARLTPLLDVLGARYLVLFSGVKPDDPILAKAPIKDPPWELLFKLDTYAIYENSRALPRCRTVAQAEIITSPPLAVYLNSDDFQPTSTVVIEEPAPLGAPIRNSDSAPSDLSEPGQVQVLEDAPERLRVHVNMQRPGWFTRMDQLLPGWTATVNGSPAKIFYGNLVGQTLFLPAGKHEILMKYEAPGLKPGIWISAVGWGGWLVLLLYTVSQGRRRRQQTDPMTSLDQ